ncbi:hypothetical protein BST13_32420 [Mycobacterium aquaticum]|uniref:Uncharacterized protein n=1 Tax=Mycobacterium aquaticum TaxID=1927124 RepID=A0A1X0A825_9MYCO|nr:hypothetical protein BST13_32420 [Mycobacterium aquaticum]
MHLYPELVGVLATAVEEGFQSRSGILLDPPLAAGTSGARVDYAVEAFGVLDFSPPQGQVPKGGGLFPWAAGTVPIHRRGRGCPFGSMCVMCGTVTWRGR